METSRGIDMSQSLEVAIEDEISNEKPCYDEVGIWPL